MLPLSGSHPMMGQDGRPISFSRNASAQPKKLPGSLAPTPGPNLDWGGSLSAHACTLLHCRAHFSRTPFAGVRRCADAAGWRHGHAITKQHLQPAR